MSGADRLTFRQAHKSRKAIETTKIVRKVNDYVLGDDPDAMDAKQLRGAEILLNKTLGNLKLTDSDIDDDGRPQSLSWDK